MKLYELDTLHTVIFGAGKAAPGIEAWLAAGGGRLLGAWATDIGPLNQVLLLREFDSAEALLAERERARRADDPFGCTEHLVGLSMDSYRPFAFLPPVEVGDFGPAYEFRTYRTRINGIAPTEAKWRDAVPPRSAYSRLTIAMYAVDGPARVTQVWPYRSLAERQEARARSVADGKWPPAGGPDWLSAEMYSAIALPLPFSPLR
jgi:hypothetical protein